MNPYISIVIPFYNRERFVKSALDSIYSQGLEFDKFEVVCVDDRSPTMDNYNALVDYTYIGEHPSNLHVIRHSVNKCQGGARNTGISVAKGEWIIHLDSDDYFIEGSLKALCNQLMANEDLDILMYDYVTNSNNINLSERFLTLQKIDGLSLVKSYSIPWVSWCYAFKRSFLMAKGLKFAENVRVEDGDYVYRAVMNASFIAFAPLQVVHYDIQEDSVSSLPKDVNRVELVTKMAIRFKKIAEDYMSVDSEAAAVCMNIYNSILRGFLSLYMGILPRKDIVYLLETYNAYEGPDFILNFAYNYPRLFSIFCLIFRPIYRLRHKNIA